MLARHLPVGWFNCAEWTDGSRKRRCPKSREELVETLTTQAEELTTGELTVHLVILDAPWPLELTGREQEEFPESEESEG